jgi:hypothetical protein
VARCPYCDQPTKPFVSSGRERKHCGGPQCARAYRKDYRPGSATLLCGYCREPFIPRRDGHRCCSQRCGQRLRSQRVGRKHPDERTAKARRYYAETDAGGLTRQARRKLLRGWQRKGRPCWACGGPAETVDHLVPITRGGTNSEGNLAPACRACNASRCDRLIIKWKHRPAPPISWPIGQNKPRRKFKRTCQGCGGEFVAPTQRSYCDPQCWPSRKRKPKICSFDGCERVHSAYGLCYAHDQQRKGGKHLTLVRSWSRRVGGCSVTGCDEAIDARGLCRLHYGRWRNGRAMSDPATYTRTCDYCGQAFTTDRAAQRFCTADHRHGAYAHRKAGKPERRSGSWMPQPLAQVA